MLTIKLEKHKLYDEENNKFTHTKPQIIRLEHSLISISKWESEFNKPFIPNRDNENKTPEEVFAYVKCMIIGDVPEYVPNILWSHHIDTILEYINASQTATVIRKSKSLSSKSKTFVTSELIYYWMTAFDIPFSTERWPINRLLVLIDICNIKREEQSKGKGSGRKKLSSARLAERRALNRERLAQQQK